MLSCTSCLPSRSVVLRVSFCGRMFLPDVSDSKVKTPIFGQYNQFGDLKLWDEKTMSLPKKIWVI